MTDRVKCAVAPLVDTPEKIWSLSPIETDGRTFKIVRIFKTKWFSRFARNNKISNDGLCIAVARVERGLIDADLGGGVINQRIARDGEDASGDFRTIVFLLAD